MKKKKISKNNSTKNNSHEADVESNRNSIKKTESEERQTNKKWLTLLLLCFLCTIIQSRFCYLMYPLIKKSDRHLRFLPDFQKENIFYCFFVVNFITVTIFLLGVFASLSQAFRTNFRPLHSFSGWLMAAILVCSISLLILFSLNRSLEQNITSSLYSAMLKFKEDMEKKEVIAQLQKENQCCGIYSYTDWFDIDFMDPPSKYQVGFPPSCCDHHNHQHCVHSVPFLIEGKLTPWKHGCVETIRKLIENISSLCRQSASFVVVGGVVLLFGVVSLKEKKDFDEDYSRDKEIELAKKFRREKEEKIEKKMFMLMVAEEAKKNKTKKKKSVAENGPKTGKKSSKKVEDGKNKTAVQN